MNTKQNKIKCLKCSARVGSLDLESVTVQLKIILYFEMYLHGIQQLADVLQNTLDYILNDSVNLLFYKTIKC